MAASVSYAEVLRKLGFRPGGGTQTQLILTVAKLALDTSHFTGRPREKVKSNAGKAGLAAVLVANSTYANSASLKRRLLASNLLQYRCYATGCTLSDSWNDLPLALQLDHVNGVHTDNRLENLRLLCPNCHSQTHTFSGKNRLPQPSKRQQFFCVCGVSIHRRSVTCNRCRVRPAIAQVVTIPCALPALPRHKIAWPSNEELKVLVWQQSVVQLAKTLGVSDVAFKKHCKKQGIPTPPRGYWAKQRAQQT